jgi:hypothetical protein
MKTIAVSRVTLARLLHVVVMGVSFAWTAPPAQSRSATPNPVKVAVLKMGLRDLYIKHIFWVRSLVISTRLGEKTVANEADVHGLDNAKDIGESIGPFYGQMAATTLTELFVNHYLGVKGYMRAAFANNFKGNETLKKPAVDNLRQSADLIALFVSGSNPNLPKSTVYALLTVHVGHLIAAINATAKKDWSAEADMWDPMVEQIYILSDTLADGIAKQFPDRFR